jgi:hypothetical protein
MRSVLRGERTAPAEKTLYDYRKELKAKGLKVQGCHEKGRTHVDLAIPDADSTNPGIGCVLAGDVKFCFKDQDALSGDDPMFHVWLNTNFISAEGGYHVLLEKSECDKAVKDKKCEKFLNDFKVEFWFAPVVESSVGPPLVKQMGKLSRLIWVARLHPRHSQKTVQQQRQESPKTKRRKRKRKKKRNRRRKRREEISSADWSPRKS